jgi:aspartate aminotransferase
MRVSDRIQRLNPSLTLQLIRKTNELRAAGRDIVTLGAGEPDFRTPVNIRDAAVRAIEEGHTKYTEVGGIAPLRQAVSDFYRDHWGLAYDARDVLVSTGAKYCLFQALQALVNDGDRVLIPQPSWLSYPEMVKAAGGVPVTIPCAEEAAFKLTPGALREAADGAKILMFNGVSNPTGTVHSPEEQAALAEVCAEFDLSVISDEIYERLVYPPATTAPFASASDDARARTLSISGVSKTFAMTGWRIGYAAGPSEVVAAMRKHQGQTTSNACSMTSSAAAGCTWSSCSAPSRTCT